MDDEDDVQPIPARKFRLIDLTILTLDAFTSWIDDVVQLMCQHANWKNARQNMIEQAHADIERITASE